MTAAAEEYSNSWQKDTIKKSGGVSLQGGRHGVLLGYDSRTVLRGLGPWRALCSMARYSTVFAITSPFKVVWSAFICLCTFLGMSASGALPEGREKYLEDIDELDGVSAAT